jgi:ABC-type siderophore export system fused ATPase/permease subunit
MLDGKSNAPLDRNFGLGWCHMVEVLAAMSWTLLSLDALMENRAGYLPTITLTGQDALDRLKKYNENEYKAALNMIIMSDSSQAQTAFQYVDSSNVSHIGILRERECQSQSRS